MKWTKFKDGTPDFDQVYITDYKYVWVADKYSVNSLGYFNYRNYGSLNPNHLWAEIPIPETPKEPKELHKCEGGGITCYQMAAQLSLEIPYGRKDAMIFRVDFCPFCGYSPKKDGKDGMD